MQQGFLVYTIVGDYRPDKVTADMTTYFKEYVDIDNANYDFEYQTKITEAIPQKDVVIELYDENAIKVLRRFIVGIGEVLV